MAQSLSFSQVRESGLFAWHPDGYLYVDGELFRAVRMQRPSSESRAAYSDEHLHVRRSSLHGLEKQIECGWHHEEACACALCAALQRAPAAECPVELSREEA